MKRGSIEFYSYYHSVSKDFAKEYLQEFKEMDKITNEILKHIKDMKKDYTIERTEKGLYFENKKTKSCFSLYLEF